MVWGAIAGAVAPAVIGGLLGGKKSQSQEVLETPEQRAARKKLMKFADTGQFGDFTAGQNLGLGLGDYEASGYENMGLSSLQNLLKGGIPSQFRLGDEALQDFLQTSPAAIEAQFNPFKTQVQRQIRESEDAFKRGAGFAGNLYSTSAIKGLGDIQARGNETLTAQLANLTNEALNRRLQAIPLAFQSGEAQQAAQLGQIAASQQYGALTRQLNDAKIKARDAEILRRRSELQLPIQAAQTVAGTPAQFGVKSVETSPFDDILGLAGQIGGQYLGNELAMKQYQRYFPSGAAPAFPTRASSGPMYSMNPNLNLYAAPYQRV